MASFVRVGDELPTAPTPAPWRQEGWAEKIETAVKNGAEYLLSVQAEEGYWHGELEADTTLESDYIYYLHVLGKAEPARIAKLANYVRQKQLADGGWPIYPNGPSELNATCKAYFALKLAGDSPVLTPRGRVSFSTLVTFQRWHAAYHYRQLLVVVGLDDDGLLEGVSLPSDVF